MPNLTQLMASKCRLGGPLQKPLVVRDSRALLIMLYWLVLLDSLDLRLVKARAASEARAIFEYFERDNDVRTPRMLAVPRIAFGAPLAYQRIAGADRDA